MKIPRPLQGVLWFISVMLFLAVMFTVMFFVTGWIYQAFGQYPPALAIQLINSLGGLLLTALIISVISRLFKSKFVEGQVRAFSPILEALERIAKGDFSARVDKTLSDHARESGVMGELADSINRMALELDQMETMRQEFISNVSHEIQSPLTSIRGFAQALQNEHLNANERAHYLSIIETESTRLSRITDNLLKLASLESEHVKFEPKCYGLDKQIIEMILACEPQWTSKQIDMDVSLEPVKIRADEDLLSQVWINLLYNSIKFTPEKGRVCVDLHRQGSRIGFKITDTGVGIAPEDQVHIFERFYKADKSRTRSNNGGSGLGLSIAQKIVEMHKGAIAVESSPGTGTTFTVSLPVE